MNEIEVKAKLKDKKGVLEYFKNKGVKFSEKKYQKDTVFWPNDLKSPKENLLGRNFMRIREQESGGIKKVLFTLKQPQTNRKDCKEYEIEIKEEDIQKLKLIILNLGYYEFTNIEKNRISAKIEDVEMCIDDVTGLGSYIELEKFGRSEEAGKIQKELNDLLGTFGIEKEDYVQDGYDIMTYNVKAK